MLEKRENVQKYVLGVVSNWEKETFAAPPPPPGPSKKTRKSVQNAQKVFVFGPPFVGPRFYCFCCCFFCSRAAFVVLPCRRECDSWKFVFFVVFLPGLVLGTRFHSFLNFLAQKWVSKKAPNMKHFFVDLFIDFLSIFGRPGGPRIAQQIRNFQPLGG